MIDSNKIKELIASSSNIVVTAHKNIDLDALGSCLGLYYICNNLDKDIHIVIEDEKIEPEIKRALLTIKKKDKIIPVTYKEIMQEINNDTLLIIVDTNKGNRIQNENLLNIKNKILIDHHIRSDESVTDLLYEYLDFNESSATEIIMDLINELNIYIPPEIATIMLAGIYIDTNGFILKTSENTHLCASTLYKFGADNKEVAYLLKQNFREYERRQRLILKTEFYDDTAITIEKTKKYTTTELAKVSDVILTFNGIEASYAIAKIDRKTIGISARSLGSIDVEKIMTYFDGGGHKTDAGAQIEGVDVELVKNELLKYIRGNK